MKKSISTFLIFLFVIHFSQITKTYNVNGIERKAIIYEPQIKSEKTPVVFFFHGHGGNAKFASQRIDFQNFYKDALVIFMEGIPGTSGYVVDKQGKMNGWQMFPNQNGNRDINFFDQVLSEIHKNYTIDDSKIFVVGHSNGARFTNVLWVERPDKIASIISVAAQGGLMISNAKPISIWMSMGKKDPLVPYENQKKSIPIVMKNLEIDAEKFTQKNDLKVYKNQNNKELIIEERNAGHEFPKESIPEMVEFLKRQKKF